MKKLSLPHPVEEIKGSYFNIYEGKTIIFGLTSSAAVYKSIDVMRELIRRNARVIAVMSEEATKLISPLLIEWATGESVFTEFGGEVGHISLGRIASSMIICPATANTIAKIAAGIGDTPVTLAALSILGFNKPLIIVPAMHYSLWSSPTFRDSLNELMNYSNVVMVPPNIKEGKAKIAKVEDIVAAAEAATLRGKDLDGFRILVTAGPSREYLDGVRFLSNPSTGKMGIAIAREAYFRGANVTLIHGPVTTSIPHYIRTISVMSAEDMLKAVLNEIKTHKYDAIIMAAAPTDFKFEDNIEGKLDSSRGINVTLIPNPKISLEIRKYFKGLIVGFSAEYVKGNKKLLKELALKKLYERGFDLVIANDISRRDIGFASDFNEVLIISEEGVIEIPKAPKSVIARAILDRVKVMLHN